MSTPELSLRVRTGIPFLIMPSPLSDVSPPSIHSILPPFRRLSPALGLPPSPWRHFHAVNFFPTLRHNWSPRARWHSVLTVIRAGNSFNYFAASTSRLSTQSSEGWYDLDPNKRRWRRGKPMTLVKATLCLLLLSLLSKIHHFLGQIISTLLKDSKMRAVTGGWKDIQIGLKLRIYGWEQSFPYWPQLLPLNTSFIPSCKLKSLFLVSLRWFVCCLGVAVDTRSARSKLSFGRKYISAQ